MARDKDFRVSRSIHFCWSPITDNSYNFNILYLSIEIARVSRDGSAKKYRNKGTRNHDLIDEEPP